MARSGVRVLRFAVIAVIIILVMFKLSTDRVDLSSYVASKGPHIEKSSGDKVPAAANPQQQAQQQPHGAKPDSKQASSSSSSSSSSDYQRANATFVTLCRNQDIWPGGDWGGLVDSIRAVEDRFNHKYHYDWVFLNDEPFDDNFKKVVSSLVSGTAKFGILPKEHWGFPEFIDQEKAAKTREEMREKKVIYGDSVPYRFMCRYESGFFWRHPEMNAYKYYWRVEPDIKLFCDIEYDVFKFMEEKGLKYGFTISLPEYHETVKTLWDSTKKFINKHKDYLPPNNMMDWLSDDGGETYNMCHFWSNFEIASLDFWRGVDGGIKNTDKSDARPYQEYFDFLDQEGGFFYERWGDAPVHSIGAALFLNKEEIHHFEDIGYWHVPFMHCPVTEEKRAKLKCSCQPESIFTWRGYSCTPRYYRVKNLERPKEWEKYT